MEGQIYVYSFLECQEMALLSYIFCPLGYQKLKISFQKLVLQDIIMNLNFWVLKRKNQGLDSTHIKSCIIRDLDCDDMFEGIRADH